MYLGCHFVYDLSEAEIVVRDYLAYNATYYYGQALKFGATDGTDLGTVVNAGAGTGLWAGMSNEGGVNDGGKTLAGTVAAGTSETLKVIVNPNGVYRIQYDDATRITWGTVTDTTIPFTCASSEGHPNIGGGWAWSYDTGKLDWIVSSATASTTCTLTTVTGTDTAEDYGILLYPQGPYVVELNSTGRKIAAGEVDVGIAKTNGFNGVILGNVMTSLTYGMEKILPANNAVPVGGYDLQGRSAPSITARMQQQTRYMAANTSYNDKARAYADVWLGRASWYTQVS